MCGRFTLIVPSYEDLAETLGVSFDGALAATYRPRYNIAPTDTSWIMTMGAGVRELMSASWGLVPWWSKTRDQAHRPINARAESAARSPTFRDAFERRRCVVVADGFYEWLPAKAPAAPARGKPPKQPVWFRRASGELMFMAGLWDSWKETASANELRSFTILTTAASSDVADVHDRMPLILERDMLVPWLTMPRKGEPTTVPNEVVALLAAPKPGTLHRLLVSSRVNNVRNDDPMCIAPPGEAFAEATKKPPRRARLPEAMPLFPGFAEPPAKAKRS